MGFFFLEPLWLIPMIIALTGLIYIVMLSKKGNKKAALKFGNINLMKMASTHQKTKKRSNVIIALEILAILFLFLALADPHIPLKQDKKGVNVVLAIDISGSMQATDYKPTRIQAAKQAAKTLVNSLENKDYVGVVSFSTGASTVSYLTPDKEKAEKRISGIAANNGATAIGDGLSLAIDMVSSIPNKKRFVVLLSDGVSNAGVISPTEAATFAKTNDVVVFTVGMGSEQPVILGYDWFGNPQYANLDETTLNQIAATTGGTYFKSIDKNTLSDIYKKLPENIKREKEPTSLKNLFLLLGIITLMSRMYLTKIKWRILR
ncbi:VWA domain-containing protein [archaeon]|nr:VWA domain-containing protein [archaeon]